MKRELNCLVPVTDHFWGQVSNPVLCIISHRSDHFTDEYGWSPPVTWGAGDQPLTVQLQEELGAWMDVNTCTMLPTAQTEKRKCHHSVLLQYVKIKAACLQLFLWPGVDGWNRWGGGSWSVCFIFFILTPFFLSQWGDVVTKPHRVDGDLKGDKHFTFEHVCRPKLVISHLILCFSYLSKFVVHVAHLSLCVNLEQQPLVADQRAC